MTNTLSKRDFERIINRICYELETIEEEGFANNPTFWYAYGRIEMIKEICEETLKGNTLSSVIGFGNESEKELQYFDSKKIEYYDSNFNPPNNPNLVFAYYLGFREGKNKGSIDNIPKYIEYTDINEEEYKQQWIRGFNDGASLEDD